MQTSQRVFKPDHPGGPPHFHKEFAAEMMRNIDPSTLEDPEGILAKLEAMTPAEVRTTIDRLNDYYVKLADLMRIGYPQTRKADITQL